MHYSTVVPACQGVGDRAKNEKRLLSQTKSAVLSPKICYNGRGRERMPSDSPAKGLPEDYDAKAIGGYGAPKNWNVR